MWLVALRGCALLVVGRADAGWRSQGLHRGSCRLLGTRLAPRVRTPTKVENVEIQNSRLKPRFCGALIFYSKFKKQNSKLEHTRRRGAARLSVAGADVYDDFSEIAQNGFA